MTPKVNPGPNITCKQCSKVFSRLDWLTNKVCDNPDCNCPEVKKSMQAANDAINKAKSSSRLNAIKVTTETIPTGRIVTEDQLVINVPPITTIEITVPRKGK